MASQTNASDSGVTTPVIITITGGEGPASQNSATPQASKSSASAPIMGGDIFLHGRIITVLVGGETGRSWSIHESLLSAKSPYFRRLLNDTEDGLKMQEVVFRDIDPKLFRMLISWLYGTSFGATAGQRVFRYPVPDGEEYTVSDYIRLYILGGQFEIVGVKNAAIDAVYSYFDENTDEVRAPSIYDVQLVFENTPNDSPMRRLLTAYCLFHLFNKKRHNIGSLPDEWVEIMTADHVVSHAMLEMLAEWGWAMGSNVPPMRIKGRQSFHDPILLDGEDGVKHEPTE